MIPATTEQVPNAARLAHLEKKPHLEDAQPSLRSLDQEPRAGLPTAEAAAHLGRQPQTLRGWACHGNGPLQPRRIAGRLLWMVPDLKRLLGMSS